MSGGTDAVSANYGSQQEEYGAHPFFLLGHGNPLFKSGKMPDFRRLIPINAVTYSTRRVHWDPSARERRMLD